MEALEGTTVDHETRLTVAEENIQGIKTRLQGTLVNVLLYFETMEQCHSQFISSGKIHNSNRRKVQDFCCNQEKKLTTN